jgi:outer membrane lipoprotein-sorting protein
MNKLKAVFLSAMVFFIVMVPFLVGAAFDPTSPAQGHNALSDLTAMRENFNQLRNFEASASTSPPSNPVGGMIWWTTDTKKIYQRDQTNTTWILLWNEEGTGYGPAWYHSTAFDASERNVKNHFIANITAAQTVHGIRQGSGNGFDADLLDGSHSSAFSASGHTHTSVDQVDGYHASATATAGKLCALDSNAKLPASITGYGYPYDNSVTTAKIYELSVTNGKLGDGSVGGSKLASGAVSGTKIYTTPASTGSQAIATLTSWIPAAGVYSFGVGADYNIRFQIYVSGGWRGYASPTGTTYCDGSNMRIYNNDESTVTVYYQKF